MKIGSHVIYVRMERGTDKQLNPVSYEATLLGQEVSLNGAEGAARLVFVHPDKLSHLNSSDWARAFEYAEQVPFEPQGEYFHGFSEPQRLSDDSINAVFGKLDTEKDAEILAFPDYPELRAQLNDYQSTFYGPHQCDCKDMSAVRMVVRRAIEQGGQMYADQGGDVAPRYVLHGCNPPLPATEPLVVDTPVPEPQTVDTPSNVVSISDSASSDSAQV